MRRAGARRRDEPDAGLHTCGGAACRDDGRRIDLRVLLLSADGQEPAFRAWEQALEREGVPHHAVIARRGHPPIDARLLTSGPQCARYQAVIVAAGGLPTFDGVRYVSALTAEEWAALEDFERDFGIRRITGFVYPSSQYGLGSPRYSGASEDLSGTLTSAGHAVFSDLRGATPIDNHAYGHLAIPQDPNFTTLVAGPEGTALVGIVAHADGREEMVSTIDGNGSMIHVWLLRHGMLRWVTRGVYLGHERHYLGLQIDDVFMADDSWDTESASTVPVHIRMRREDVEAAVRWSQESGVRLDMAFNGEGAQESDDLIDALLEHKEHFGWVNHTFSHAALDDADTDTLRREIVRNIEYAAAAGLEIDAAELVTGGHSGLKSFELPGVLAELDVRWVAVDNSRDSEQRAIGSALTVPRHPTNMYFNVCTREAQLDEYQHQFSTRMGRPSPGATRTRLAPATTWTSFVEREAQTILDHVLGNDPRPHFLHQSNLAGERMLYDLIDEVLARHRELFCVELVQPTLAEAGAELARRATWRQALSGNHVVAYLQDRSLHLSAREPVQVPVTGVAGIGADSDEDSSWSNVIGPEDGLAVIALA